MRQFGLLHYLCSLKKQRNLFSDNIEVLLIFIVT